MRSGDENFMYLNFIKVFFSICRSVVEDVPKDQILVKV